MGEIIEDALIRYSLPIASLRSQTYDGASNNPGKYKGYQFIITHVQTLATYVHYKLWVAYLVTSKAAQTSTVVRSVLKLVENVITQRIL